MSRVYHAGGGVICNVTSSSVLAPVPFLGAYRSSKAAVGAIGESLMAEVAKWGIRVLEVMPGPIETDMFYDVIPKDSPKVEQLARSIPVGRIGRPADVARAVMFFASRDAGFITGQSLYVCGGASIGSIGL